MKNFAKIYNSFFVLLFLIQFSACAQGQNSEPAKQPAAAPARKSNEEISAYVRKIFNVPSNVTITVRNNTSKFEGMQGIIIEFVGERGSQTQEAWVTADQTLLVGRTYDMSVDPYQKNWEKIDLTNVPMTGAPEAKVTIVEYSDFQCPYCSRAHVTVKELLQQYNGKIKVAFKHLPLNNIHPWAEDAAIATSCAYLQKPEAFWQLGDYFFTNQATLKKETLAAGVMEAAKGMNLKTEQLQKCMTDRATMDTVKANAAEAGALGFGSTPSFVVNGRSVIGAVSLEDFKVVVDEALAAVK